MDRLSVNRRGSALLIVLGMLAFMVISAVAFSAYMRLSRLPSSFLRRTVSTRLLVKAALAKAIDEIDVAIGDNPHPNVGATRYVYPRRPTPSNYPQQITANRNHWLGRVYMGGDTSTAANNTVKFLDQNETVSPLCLEALAYLPPTIVNEVRYFSRHSSAAEWHDLDYDSGRYAFCAVDVSDYFDINAMHADMARTSDPEGRVSLAYLFENADHTAAKGLSGMCDVDQWGDFMSNFLPDGKSGKTGGNSSGNKVPLVSLADWNLALNQYKPGGMISPFCDYVTQNKANFYGFNDEGDDADRIRRMPFVTDSYFPESETASGELDLNRYQPFRASDLSREKPSITSAVLLDDDYLNKESVEGSNLKVYQYFQRLLCGVGFAALYDYLDFDRVPCSLAIPTVERVPMICGVQPTVVDCQFEIDDDSGTPMENKEAMPQGPEETRTYKATHVYKFKPAMISDMKLGVLLAYPFRHDDKMQAKFKVDGCIKFFLNVDGEEVGIRTGTPLDAIHYVKDDAQKATVANGVISVPFKSVNVNTPFKNGVVSEMTDAMRFLPLDSNHSALSAALGDCVFMSYTRTTEQKAVRDGGDDENPKYRWEPTNEAIEKDPKYITEVHSDFAPLSSKGVVNKNFDKTLSDKLKAGEEIVCKLKAAVAARVVYDSGDPNTLANKTVDLVPACVRDDDNWNGHNNGGEVDEFLGSPYPILKFDAGVEAKFAETPVAKASIAVTPTAAVVADPRFNHLSECWAKWDMQLNDTQSWLNWCMATDRANGRDGDIFMEVSDQGYLQSVYELANLPRLTEFYQNENTKYDVLGQSRIKIDARTELVESGSYNENTVPNYNLMWKTYDPFPGDGYDGDRFDLTEIVSRGQGCLVNPYSDCPEVIAAAFANAPHSWRFSGTNEMASVIQQGLPSDAAAFNQQYAWNAYGSGAGIEWEDIENVADKLIDRMHPNSGTPNFENIWRNLGWYSNANNPYEYLLNDQTLRDTSAEGRIYNTDKKFLYGYWHDSFAAKQQLFLVFVRAEPMMMGGGSAESIPPTLGAKAVALVWRDPNALGSTATSGAASGSNGGNSSSSGNANEVTPHRTRILFYRQFD